MKMNRSLEKHFEKTIPKLITRTCDSIKCKLDCVTFNNASILHYVHYTQNLKYTFVYSNHSLYLEYYITYIRNY